MSGVLQIPNQFASAVTATGQQLDADFNTVTAYINDPTNRNNYGADTGATNTVAISFSPPVIGGYTAGLELTWKWAATNSGAVVVNANSLGNKNLVNPDNTNLQAGQGTAGSIGKAVYDGTQFIFISSSQTPASAAQVSAAATLVPYVSPGRVQNHPGVAKVWASFVGTSTGTITALDSYNVGSIVRNGTGTYSITFTTPFANTNYAPTGSSTASGDSLNALSRGTGTCTFAIQNNSGVPSDATQVVFLAFGSQ